MRAWTPHARIAFFLILCAFLYFVVGPLVRDELLRRSFRERSPQFVLKTGLPSRQTPLFEPGYEKQMVSADYPNPYLRGKVIVLNYDGPWVDEIHRRLPKEVRATKAEEIGTVVWVKKTHLTTGNYLDSQTSEQTGEGKRWRYDIRIIDLSIPEIVGGWNFFGSAPPDEIKGRAASGDEPTNEVIDYLSALPRK